MISEKQASKLKCLDLLDLAKKDDMAAREIERRAHNWETCAVGEQATKLHVRAYDLIDLDITLEAWGVRFAEEVSNGFYGRAKRTYNLIEKRVKRLFPNKKSVEKTLLLKRW